MKHSVPSQITTEDDLDQWITFFYLDPKPNLTTQAIQLASETDDFDQAEVLHVNISFYAIVFQQYPHILENVFKVLVSLPKHHRHTIYSALRMCNTTESIKILETAQEQSTDGEEQSFLATLIEKTPPDLKTMPISTPADIDMLWSAFHATGEEEYVVRIINALRLGGIVGHCANWSLGSMAFQHPRILEICQEQTKNVTAEILPTLQSAIQVAEEKLKDKPH